MILQITDKERKHYDEIINTTCPMEALVGRVVIVQVREEDELAEQMNIPGLAGRDVIKVGGLYIPKESKENIRDCEVVKAVVKSIGPTRDGSIPPYKINDLVLVLPHTFETILKTEKLDYFVYGYSDMIVKITKVEQADIYCDKAMD